MRKFVNIYILLFLVDGFVTLLCALVEHLSIVQGIIAFVVLLMSFPLYFFVGCIRGFPKRVVLPLILFTIWAGLFFAFPIPVFLGVEKTMLLLSIIQICIGIVAIAALRFSSGNIHWLYCQSNFEQLAFHWKRLIGFVAANLILVIPLIGLYLAVSFSFVVSHLSQDFIHIGFRGISFETRTYLFEGKNIILMPTAHIAQTGFYEKSIKPLPAKNTVVIPEGVTDKTSLLKGGIGYEEMASSLGVEAQSNQIIIADRDTKYCDVDVSDLSPEIIAMIQSCSRINRYWASGDRDMALQELVAAPEPDLSLFYQELIEIRNHRVTECIPDCLQSYDNIIIPWGALHMPGIENTILEWGGTVGERRRNQVWSW